MRQQKRILNKNPFPIKLKRIKMALNEITNSQPELICLVGLPGIGKSYIIETIMRDNSEKDYVIVSSDNIISAIAESQGKTYSDVFDKTYKRAAAQMNTEATDAIKNRRNIIWDQTNLAPGKRASILNRLSSDYYKKAVVITANEEVHAQRLKSRAEKEGKHIPHHVINNMRKSYVEPTKDEGFDEIVFIDNS